MATRNSDEALSLGSHLFQAGDEAAETGNYVVYHGFDAAGDVRYVGITRRDPTIRFGEHLRATGSGRELLNYRVVPGSTNLTRTQARVIEQNWIIQYGLGPNGGQLLNVRNSIARHRWANFGIRQLPSQ